MALTSKSVELFDEVSDGDDEGDFWEIKKTEWRKLKVAVIKDGFADGKNLGEQSPLFHTYFRNGCNHGFSDGFELAQCISVSQSMSVIRGLLNGLQTQLSDPVLITRSIEIEKKLEVLTNDFIKSFNEYFENKSLDSNDEYLDLIDENRNNYIPQGNSKNNPEECYFSSLKKDILVKNSDRIEMLLMDFVKLKGEIADLISDCKQPAIADQVSVIYEKSAVPSMLQFSPCTQCTRVNESTHTDCLSATS